MLLRFFFLYALLLGHCLSAADDRPRLLLHLPHRNKAPPLSDDPLIKNACHNVGKFSNECISTLQSAPADQKTDTKGLAFFTLKFIEDHAVNLIVDIKKLQSSDLPPLLDSALGDCLDQYNPLDDLIEDAVNAVVANKYDDAQTFIDAAMTDIVECDTELKASDKEERLEHITGDDIQLANNLKEYNVFLKNMLSAASNILKAK